MTPRVASSTIRQVCANATIAPRLPSSVCAMSSSAIRPPMVAVNAKPSERRNSTK
jgi:hypothetical protein